MSDNWLFRGDAAEVAARLPDGIELDLVYLDPPYATGSVMTARSNLGEARGRKKKDSGADAYDDTADVRALIAMLTRSLQAIRARMRRGAALYLHLDHRAIHEAKVAADGVFGRGAFQGEIIWTPGNGARGAGLSVTHQTILVYVRAPHEPFLFNVDEPMLREPYAATSLAMHFKNRDEQGRAFRERTIAGKTYRYYADQGRKLGSVWTDAPAMVANTPLRKEATGYPTQKPEKLLERIVRASSAEGSVVADLMCGSGTTLVVAARLGRRFVGGDIGEVALTTTAARLRAENVHFVEG